jgi:hypothetical protein
MSTLLRRMCSRVLLVLTAAMIVALITSANGAAGSSLELAPAFQRLGNLFAMIPIDTATLAQTSCGPPTYPCARRDLRVAKLPEPVPNVGGVRGEGTIITDPDFGTEIIRVTDVDTDPHLKTCAAQHSYCFASFVTAGGGSAYANVWNTNDTMFEVTSTVGTTYVLGWDPEHLTVSRPFSNLYPARGGLSFPFTGLQWSRMNPNWIYGVRNTRLLKFDLTDRSKAPVAQVLFDFAAAKNCLPTGFESTWHSAMNVGAADQTFSIAFSNSGGQETGIYVAVYKVGSGCSLLNTATGKVTGNWGQVGIISVPYRFTLHNISGSRNNSQLLLSHNKCTSIISCPPRPYFWRAGTTSIQICPVGGLCTGHWVDGFTHWINNDGDPVLGASHIRPYTQVTKISLITPLTDMSQVAVPFDQHMSWNNNKGTDTVPYYSISASITEAGAPIFPFPAAWYDEGLIFPFDGSGVRREHHTFTSGRNQRFNAKWAIGQISQTGRFSIFTSDWMNTLGCENGSSGPCTVGSMNGHGYRADVFVVELK